MLLAGEMQEGRRLRCPHLPSCWRGSAAHGLRVAPYVPEAVGGRADAGATRWLLRSRSSCATGVQRADHPRRLREPYSSRLGVADRRPAACARVPTDMHTTTRSRRSRWLAGGRCAAVAPELWVLIAPLVLVSVTAAVTYGGDLRLRYLGELPLVLLAAAAPACCASVAEPVPTSGLLPIARSLA